MTSMSKGEGKWSKRFNLRAIFVPSTAIWISMWKMEKSSRQFRRKDIPSMTGSPVSKDYP